MSESLETIKLEIETKKKELAKLTDKLHELEVLTRLSPVYKNRKCYGVAYQDGHGNVEPVNYALETRPESLESRANERKGDFVNGILYIVGLEIVSVEKVIN